MTGVWVRQPGIGDGEHLEHHAPLPGAFLGDLLVDQGSHSQGEGVHHEGHHPHQVDPGHRPGLPAANWMQQICL